jgi:hypothetical protein
MCQICPKGAEKKADTTYASGFQAKGESIIGVIFAYNIWKLSL